jgi:hypothetical protein
MIFGGQFIYFRGVLEIWWMKALLYTGKAALVWLVPNVQERQPAYLPGLLKPASANLQVKG